MRLFTQLCSFAAATCLVAAAYAENNAAYDSWAKHKPGTSVTHKATGEMMGQKNETEMKWTLIEVTPEKAVVELKMTVNAMGQKMEQPAQNQDIPAKTPEGQPGDPIAAAKQSGAEVKELADEDVTVAGTSYKCKVIETKMKQGENTITGKTWISNDIPNMLVKAESTMEGQMAGKQSVEVTELVTK